MLYIVVGLLVAAASALWYAARIEPRRMFIRRQVIEFERAQFPLEKLTILHISDLHIRLPDATKAWMIERVRDIAPDLTVITGDLIERDSGTDFCVDLVSRLRARLGVYAVLGNHDHFYGSDFVPRQIANAVLNLIYFDHRQRNDTHDLVRKLETRGVRVLINESLRLRVDGKPLWLAGVDDPVSGQDDLGRALGGIPPQDFTILLTHSPESAYAARDRGVDLVLAGHTHGGQVKIPFVGALVSRTRHRVPTVGGIKRMGSTWLYVSAGLGASVPLRFLSPPEATLIELRRRRN